MAVTTTNLATAGNTTNQTSYTTASISPSSNKLLIAVITNGFSGTPNTPTLSGNGLTWVQFGTPIIYDTVGTSHKLSLYRAMGASPSAGAVTISMGGQTSTGCVWSIIEFDGVDTTGTNGSGAVVQNASAQDESGSVTSLTATLSSFSSANNATFGGAASASSATLSAGSGFTSSWTAAIASSDQQVFTEFRADNDTSVDFSWTPEGGAFGIFGVEIKAGATSSIKKILGVSQASVKKVSSVALASIKKISSIAN